MRVRKWRISGNNNHSSRFNHKIFNLQYLNFYLQKYLFCLFLLFKYSKIIINNKKQWLVCGFALSDYSFIAYPIFSITFSITVEFVGIPSPNNYFKDDIVLQIVPQWYKLVNFTRNKFFFKETCIDRCPFFFLNEEFSNIPFLIPILRSPVTHSFIVTLHIIYNLILIIQYLKLFIPW